MKDVDQYSVKNTTVLANAVELSSQVIMKVAGNEVANSVGGETITPPALGNAVLAKMQSCLKKKGASQ